MEPELLKLSFYWESGDFVLYNPSPKNEDVVDSSMIYNLRKHNLVIIENDEVAYAIKQNMLNAGIPVLSEPPPGKDILQEAMERLSCLGMGTKEYTDAYNEIRGLHLSGRSRADIESRIQELCRSMK